MLTPLQELYEWIANESMSGMFETPTPTQVLEKIESMYQKEKNHLSLAFDSSGENTTAEEWFNYVYNGKSSKNQNQANLFSQPSV